MTNLVNQFPSIQQMTESLQKTNGTVHKGIENKGMSFAEVFQTRTQTDNTLKFSKHASSRMETRNIDLTQEQWERLETGVMKAGEKGINESLVMIDNLAFIVNVNNNTVITAVGEADEKIFTNIDGAVIA